MIGCYLTGTLPRPAELIEITRAYDRGKIDARMLEKAFEDATKKAIKAQISTGSNYVTDGMLKWQDLLRPLAEKLDGIEVGSLARWFNNNIFYRKPIVTGQLHRKRSVIKEITYTKLLPKNIPWKAILPAPFTFVQLSENRYYKDEVELLFDYAKVLREEIKSLANLGFKYVQLSDPALVYEPFIKQVSKDDVKNVIEALSVAVKGLPIKTCLQTYFGDFTKILPDALNFPVNHLGIDLYETNLEELKCYKIERGLSLGVVDSRSSLIENKEELVNTVKELIKSMQLPTDCDVFVCPNCDLEFLPWEVAQEKMRLVASVAKCL